MLKLTCPVDGAPLAPKGPWLVCDHDHRYPVVQGVPVLLRPDATHTIALMQKSWSMAVDWVEGRGDDPAFIETLGVSDAQKTSVRDAMQREEEGCDPVVSHLVAATNGNLYTGLVGRLADPPIPLVDLPRSEGGHLLDIGCSWGRWSMAAAALGYRPVGIDPSLGAVLAAMRLARKLGVPFQGVVGDARHLPFATAAFDAAFSYSVLQHFSRADAQRAVQEIARVLVPGGLAKVQMASSLGIRSLHVLLRRGFSEGRDFDVRYWRPRELRRLFERTFGSARVDVDCYFGLGLQPSDAELMAPSGRLLVAASERLRILSTRFRPLVYAADSLFLTARNVAGHGGART